MMKCVTAIYTLVQPCVSEMKPYRALKFPPKKKKGDKGNLIEVAMESCKHYTVVFQTSLF